jgi:ATP synthase protein I
LALRPKSALTGWGRGFESGLEFALCVVVGTALGYFLDRWLGTEPWLLLVFTGFGFAAGLRVLMRVLSDAAGSDASKAEDDGP